MIKPPPLIVTHLQPSLPPKMMQIRFHMAVLGLALSTTSTATAQKFWHLNDGPGNFAGSASAMYSPTQAYPTGRGGTFPLPSSDPSSLVRPTTFVGAAATPAAGSAGGFAIDQLNGWFFCTDGTVLTIDPHPQYPGLPAPGLTTIPLTGSPIGTVTGLAINSHPGARRLWMVDALGNAVSINLAGLTAAPPVFSFGATLTLSNATFPTTTTSISGLGFDPDGAGGGSLWATDAAGLVSEWAESGAGMIGTPSFALAGLPAGQPITGLAVNTTNRPATFAGAPGDPASSFHVAVSNGSSVFDALNANPLSPLVGNALPGGIPPGGIAGTAGFGLAFCADPQYLPNRRTAGLGVIAASPPSFASELAYIDRPATISPPGLPPIPLLLSACAPAGGGARLLFIGTSPANTLGAATTEGLPSVIVTPPGSAVAYDVYVAFGLMAPIVVAPGPVSPACFGGASHVFSASTVGLVPGASAIIQWGSVGDVTDALWLQAGVL